LNSDEEVSDAREHEEVSDAGEHEEVSNAGEDEEVRVAREDEDRDAGERKSETVLNAVMKSAWHNNAILIFVQCCNI